MLNVIVSNVPIRNEKVAKFHKILAPNLYIRVFPDGDVLYSIRTSLRCACSMYLARFPLDQQTCYLYLASCRKRIFTDESCLVLFFRWLDQE